MTEVITTQLLYLFTLFYYSQTVGSREFLGTKELSGCLTHPHFEALCTLPCAGHCGKFER